MFDRKRGINKNEENYIMSNFEIYTFHAVLLGLLNCGLVVSSTGGERSSACHCLVTYIEDDHACKIIYLSTVSMLPENN